MNTTAPPRNGCSSREAEGASATTRAVVPGSILNVDTKAMEQCLDHSGLVALGLRGLHAAVVAGDPIETDDLVPLVNLARELQRNLTAFFRVTE